MVLLQDYVKVLDERNAWRERAEKAEKGEADNAHWYQEMGSFYAVAADERDRLRAALLTLEGQCREEHHWKGNCPAEAALAQRKASEHDHVCGDPEFDANLKAYVEMRAERDAALARVTRLEAVIRIAADDMENGDSGQALDVLRAALAEKEQE